MTTREPAVAGLFYPADTDTLRRTVAALLDAAEPPAHRRTDKRLLQHAESVGKPGKALIAPHAGFVYSGPVAASAYRSISALRGIARVVLIGPSHRVAFAGLAAPTSTHYATPLGTVPVDRDALGTLADLPQVVTRDDAHRDEHSLEVHLPFLQQVLGEFSLVPLVVGDAGPAEVAQVLERLWGGDETLIVVSTDLSHYHDYDAACAIDAQTAADIVARRATLTGERACGCRGVNGLLTVAERLGLEVRELDRRNSGDTAGPRDRVVGYGAYAVGSA